MVNKELWETLCGAKKDVEEQACARTRVLVQVEWVTNEILLSKSLEFSCIYQNELDDVALPWRDNGEWVIIPLDIRGLYQ